jgi:hypothetical protein
MRSLLVTPLVVCCSLIGAAEISLSIPSDANANFFVLEKSGKGPERTIVTKRIGASETSFLKYFYNYKDDTVKYLGPTILLKQWIRHALTFA